MAHRKTHRRRHHSKRKTSQRTHRRRTHRRGGRAVPRRYNRAPNPCQHYIDRFINIQTDLNNQTAETIEDFVGEVRSFYNEVELRPECQFLLDQIVAFENEELSQRMDNLLS
jgi:hypothetical protein